MALVWTAENIQTAIGLWNSGKTGGEIAQAINAPSRGSVTRQISRLRAQGAPIEWHSSRIKPKPVRIEAEMPVIRRAPAQSDGPVTLLEAGFRQCRYPLWDKRSDPRIVCGKKTVSPNSSWCEEHHRVVWKSAQRRVRLR